MPAKSQDASARQLASRRAWEPSRRGGVQVSELQRSRMLSSAVALVTESGYGRMSVARVTNRAGVSRRTFYDIFADREDCFLTAFDELVLQVGNLMRTAYARERGGWKQIRAALAALLGFLDDEPGARALLIVDALKAGPRVLSRRVEVLQQLSTVLQQGGSQANIKQVPPLTGEGVVGAVVGVIHTRLLAERPGPMVDLLNPLMAMIVLPYQGPAAAQKELDRPAPERNPMPRASRPAGGRVELPTALPIRITYRTLRVLTVIEEHPGVSNRQVADLAEISDQGQISRLLRRLEGLGLVLNTGGEQPSGEPNAWRLTPAGRELQRAIQAQTGRSDHQTNEHKESH